MHMVNIILADTGQIERYADEIIGGIPQYYAANYKDMKAKQEACQELAAGFLLKSCLGVYEDGQMIRNVHGKPMLRSGRVHFNLSHSGLYAALAIADMEIGVDIEKIMDVHWPSVRKVFSVEQQTRLKQTPEPKQSVLFTKMWTECEAVLKLSGTGFAVEKAARPAQPVVHWLPYGNYMIACAADEEFQVSIREAEIGGDIGGL